MKLLRFGLFLLLSGLCLSVWAGFAGSLHPAGDSLSLFRVVLGGLCMICLLLPMSRRWRAGLGLTAAAALLTTVPLFFGGNDGDTLTVYSKNIWYRNPQLSQLAADIRESGADVVTLQEVSRGNEALMVQLKADYPHQHICRFSGWSAVAVLSRFPVTEARCTSRRAVGAARIHKDGQDIWVGSVHLPWPFPYGNARAADAAQEMISGLAGPVVLAGDFNIFPWANSVQRLGQAASAQVVRPLRPTFNLRGLPLLLDHVHAPGGGQAEYRGLIGSDHLGVLARVSLHGSDT